MLYCQEVKYGALLRRDTRLMTIRNIKVSKPKPQADPPLDQKQIVQAALGLLDEVGLDGLTMRSLAKKLDIQAASLYWHVRNKQDLLGLMAEEICASMREPDRALPWRDKVEVLADEYRRVLLAHRDGARVLASSGGPSGPNRLRLMEIALSALLDAGFNHKDAAYAGFLLNDFVTMFVVEEASFANAEAEDAAQEPSSSTQDWVDALPPNEYPSVVTLASYLIDADMDERFRFGVEVLRNGLESRLSKAIEESRAETQGS